MSTEKKPEYFVILTKEQAEAYRKMLECYIKQTLSVFYSMLGYNPYEDKKYIDLLKHYNNPEYNKFAEKMRIELNNIKAKKIGG